MTLGFWAPEHKGTGFCCLSYSVWSLVSSNPNKTSVDFRCRRSGRSSNLDPYLELCHYGPVTRFLSLMVSSSINYTRKIRLCAHTKGASSCLGHNTFPQQEHHSIYTTFIVRGSMFATLGLQCFVRFAPKPGEIYTFKNQPFLKGQKVRYTPIYKR